MSNLSIYSGEKAVGTIDYNDDQNVKLNIPEKYSDLLVYLNEAQPADEDSDVMVNPGTLEHALLALKEAFIENGYTYLFDEEDTAENALRGSVDNKGGGNPNHDPKSGQFSTGTGTPAQKKTLAKEEDSIRNQSTETFVAVDEGGGIVLKKDGTTKDVTIAPIQMDMLKDTHNVIYTHNHPSNASFSRDDIITGAKIDAKEIRITSKKYDYTFRPGHRKVGTMVDTKHNWPREDIIRNMYDYFEGQAYSKYVPQVKSGEMTINEAWMTHSNEVMTEFAAALGGNYTREERP